MKTKISITSIWGNLLFEYEKENNTIKDTLAEAVKRGANLQEADLREADLREADLQEANLWGANLWGANLQGANLQEANLREANLRRANLREADLQEANLWGANLQEANLWGANLQEAKNVNPLQGSLLSLLKQQKNKLVAYKYVTPSNTSPQQGDLDYRIGKTVSLNKKECDYSELVECSKGLHVATIEWCITNRTEKYPIIEVEFDPKDIVSIPYNTDGKFRVRKLKVLRIVPEEETEKIKTREVK